MLTANEDRTAVLLPSAVGTLNLPWPRGTWPEPGKQGFHSQWIWPFLKSPAAVEAVLSENLSFRYTVIVGDERVVAAPCLPPGYYDRGTVSRVLRRSSLIVLYPTDQEFGARFGNGEIERHAQAGQAITLIGTTAPFWWDWASVVIDHKGPGTQFFGVWPNWSVDLTNLPNTNPSLASH